MSREIIFYAEKNRNPETRIELYWTGADSAQLLFEGLKELSYNNQEDYIPVDKAATQLRLCLNNKVEDIQKDIQHCEKLIESLRADLHAISSVELYGEIRERMSNCYEYIEELKEDLEFYSHLRHTMAVITNLDFLNTRYDGTPSEWELYVLYSY